MNRSRAQRENRELVTKEVFCLSSGKPKLGRASWCQSKSAKTSSNRRISQRRATCWICSFNTREIQLGLSNEQRQGHKEDLTRGVHPKRENQTVLRTQQVEVRQQAARISGPLQAQQSQNGEVFLMGKNQTGCMRSRCNKESARENQTGCSAAEGSKRVVPDRRGKNHTSCTCSRYNKESSWEKQTGCRAAEGSKRVFRQREN